MDGPQPVNVTVVNKGCGSGCSSGCAALILVPFTVFLVWRLFETQGWIGDPKSDQKSEAVVPVTTPVPAPAQAPPVATPKLPAEVKASPDAQARAVRAYPALGVQNSPLHREFLARYKRYQVEKPAFFSDPEWPTMLAMEAAAEPARLAAEKAARAEAERKAAMEENAKKLEAEIGPTPYVEDKWPPSVVQRNLKQVLKDPDSIQYIQVLQPVVTEYEGQKCWVVKFRYRAKNSFGGYVISDAAAYIQNNHLLGLKQSDPSR